jgi:glycosyltransferase involved in cell wall biosynthesis
MLRSDLVELSHVPWRDDWHALADEHTVVLLGSAYEGLGNVLIESAKRRIPVVAGSNALGCADAILPGVTGYLAEVDSVESYADALLDAIALDGSNLLESWLEQFSSDATAKKLNNLLCRS